MDDSPPVSTRLKVNRLKELKGIRSTSAQEKKLPVQHFKGLSKPPLLNSCAAAISKALATRLAAARKEVKIKPFRKQRKASSKRLGRAKRDATSESMKTKPKKVVTKSKKRTTIVGHKIENMFHTHTHRNIQTYLASSLKTCFI